jgi:hypothetical protein
MVARGLILLESLSGGWGNPTSPGDKPLKPEPEKNKQTAQTIAL